MIPLNSTLLRLVMLPLVIITLSAPGWAQEEPKAGRKNKAGKGAEVVGETAMSTEQTFANFGQMIPMGTKNKKVRIPSFEAGKPTSLITADSMTRVSDQELYAEEMVIENYANDPKANLTVKLHSATYDLNKKTLSSKQRSRVERSDFSIEGDSMVYDTTNASGKMVGRVVMIINDAGALNPKPAAEPTQKTPEQPATPAPAPTSAAK